MPKFGRLVDLTQTLSPETQVFPVYPRVAVLPWVRREASGFSAEVLFAPAHAGTHLDAPLHFVAGGRAVDELPLERLVGDCVLLDLRGRCGAGKARIGPAELAEAERAGGVGVAPGDMVVLWTGWERLAGSDAYLTEHPGLSGEGAGYLADRGVRLVGLDTPNLDHPDEGGFPAHRALLGRGVLVLENLTNLAAVASAARRFVLACFPLKLRGGSGSPVRAVAFL